MLQYISRDKHMT